MILFLTNIFKLLLTSYFGAVNDFILTLIILIFFNYCVQ